MRWFRPAADHGEFSGAARNRRLNLPHE